LLELSNFVEFSNENQNLEIGLKEYFGYYNQSPNGHYGIYDMGKNLVVKLIVPF
jgi:hypothetical protein